MDFKLHHHPTLRRPANFSVEQPGTFSNRTMLKAFLVGAVDAELIGKNPARKLVNPSLNARKKTSLGLPMTRYRKRRSTWTSCDTNWKRSIRTGWKRSLNLNHYTKKTIDLSASIELAFRINDRSGNVIGQPVDVYKNNHKTAVVLENVRPEDTEGITNQSVEPDEAQFLTDLEIEARNALVKAVRKKASELPPRSSRRGEPTRSTATWMAPQNCT